MSKVNIIKKIYRDLPQPIKVLAQPIRFVYGIPSAIKKEMLLEVKLTSGKLKNYDLDLSVLVVGRGSSLSYITNRFFEDGYKVKNLGHEFVWNLGKKIKDFRQKSDAVLLRLHKLFVKPFSNNGYHILPTDVRQKLDLGLSIEQLKKIFKENVNHSDMRRLSSFTCTISHDINLLKNFYNNIYIPYARQRFGELASISKYELVKDSFRRGGLLLINYQDSLVCAGVYSKTKREYSLKFLGLSAIGLGLFKKGVLSALYYFSIISAKEMGFRMLDFGQSRPFLKDGVFFQKVKWGTFVKKNKGSPHYLFLKINHLNTLTKRLLMDNPFISVRKNRLVANVFDFDREFNDESLQKELMNRYFSPGLNLECVTKNNNNHSLLKTYISEKGRVLNQSIINDLCDRQDAKYR